ncbi:related to syntaxin 18 [Ramularia collo-cygni]|uniref:Related to syntaxin 18 n=1 Tax=Ramularia collo-cygni TaxID=112498 RepID=A0A2D3V4C3_9PEZI|nr:related to syntaxin 18 [Ramularia collo-cygni]CZT19537.1 related to syntaxin 18 [Ramularia collo-cygni]
MTDITADFSICLKEKGVESIAKKEFDLQNINAFLQEAYFLNARIAELNRDLRAIRPAYLSAAQPSRRRHIAGSGQSNRVVPLTDAQRDFNDAESKRLLRELNAKIDRLKQVESVRNQTADTIALKKRSRGGLGGLGRWAAGGAVTAKSPEEEMEDAARKTMAAVRESIILFLQGRLEEAGRVQSEMMDIRLSREIEKSKSILAKSKVGGTIPHIQDEEVQIEPSSSAKRMRMSGDFGSGSAFEAPAPAELTQEQMQQFQEENHELLKHYEDQLDQVKTAEKSILEISELHSTLHANLQQQSEHIDQLVQDSYLATENLGKGNKELKRASERRSTAQALFYSTVAFCSFLVVWDFFI